MPLVLLATCSELPDLDDDTRTLADALTARGVTARPAVWDDHAVDWSAADLVMVRSTWDYAKRRDEFLAWAERVDTTTRLHNAPPVLRWTTDKTYLRDLAEAGVPTVPTAFLDSDSDVDEPHPYVDVEHVVKPAVSAGSLDTTRVAAGDHARSRERARAILDSGRTVLVQPYVASVDEHGETALVYVDGRFSHALRKAAILTEEHGDADGLFVEEDMSVREPSAEEHDVAQRVLAAIPGGTPLYARVDLLPGPDGPVLLELELAEPSFFLDLVPEAADTVADAVIARLS